jgi:hypothetical protein
MMNALDSILKSCIQSDESSKRRPSTASVSSKQSNTQTLLNTIEEKLDNIVQTVHDLPVAIEERFDGFMRDITDIPTTLEETFDDLMHTLNEYSLSFESPFNLENSPFRVFVLKVPV